MRQEKLIQAHLKSAFCWFNFVPQMSDTWRLCLGWWLCPVSLQVLPLKPSPAAGAVPDLVVPWYHKPSLGTAEEQTAPGGSSVPIQVSAAERFPPASRCGQSFVYPVEFRCWGFCSPQQGVVPVPVCARSLQPHRGARSWQQLAGLGGYFRVSL